MQKYVFKLFITGQTPRSENAINSLRRICDQEIGDSYELIIIDVLEHPESAEAEKILATPTLIRQSPPPVRRIIGDLSDSVKVLQGLGLHSKPF